jgi:hypothetical protein
LIRKREQKIYTTNLRITHVVAAFSVLTIMPFDLMFGKVLERALTDIWKEILLGIFQWYAEGAVFGSVESILPGFGSEGGGGLFEGSLVWFFGFEEFGHWAPL